MTPAWGYLEGAASWVLGVWSPAGELVEAVAEDALVVAASLTAVAPRNRLLVAEAMQDRHGVMPAAEVFDGPPAARVSLTCPACWRVSFDPAAARSRVCPVCPAGVRAWEGRACGGAGLR